MIIDGKAIAQEIQAEIRQKVSAIQGEKPCLAVILVGNHPPSEIYVNRKTEACNEVGIRSLKLSFPENASESDVLKKIQELNGDPSVDGILVQLPLPHQINPSKIVEAISPQKDVDGFHPVNVGKLLIGETSGFFPCTPLGIQVLLEKSGIEIAGKHAVIIGRSNIVGKPMAALLLQTTAGGNATVTVLHRRSPFLKEFCLLADVIIIAIGQPKFLKKEMVRPGAVVIDVGINKINNSSKNSGYQIVGDADFEELKDICSFITPVPGGVGPMTIAMLLQNTLKSFQNRKK